MTSSRKRGEENGQDVEDMGRVTWSKETFLIFFNCCIELIDKSEEKNGDITSQRLRWKDIVSDF